MGSGVSGCGLVAIQFVSLSARRPFGPRPLANCPIAAALAHLPNSPLSCQPARPLARPAMSLFA